MFNSLSLKFVTVLVLAGYVRGHGFITDIKGANGKTRIGFGVDAAQITPGNQGPTSVINGAATGCGRGVTAGQINVATDLEAAIQAGLPTADASGSISMNWRQVNAGADGGGPGIALIDVTGTGNNFKPVTISKDFGDGGADSDNPMTIAIPAGTVCTGGSAGNACLLRVTNPPGFGSCFAIALSGSTGGAAASTSSAAAVSTSAAAASSSTATSAAAVTSEVSSSTTAAISTSTSKSVASTTSISTSAVATETSSAVSETATTTVALSASSSAAQCAVTPTITVTVTPTASSTSTPCLTDPVTVTVTRGAAATASGKALNASGKNHHKVNGAKAHSGPRGISSKGYATPQRMRRMVRGF